MSTQIEWADRIAAAAKALGNSPDEFTKDLAETMGLTPELGLTALDDEDIFKFGDFREAFKSRPIAVLRIAFKALKGGKRTEPGDNSASNPRLQELRGLGLKVRVEDADPASLLPYYLPDKPADPVTVALKKRFGDKPVLAFSDDGKVALTETLQYIADLEQNYPARDAVMVDGKLAKLWPVGAMPNAMVDEDPLFPNQPLRGGYSLVNHRNWNNVTMANRQMCRIIVRRGEIDPENRDAVLRLLERAQIKGELQTVYPESYLEFRELDRKDELPKLKVELGASPSKPNNPFGVARKY